MPWFYDKQHRLLYNDSSSFTQNTGPVDGTEVPVGPSHTSSNSGSSSAVPTLSNIPPGNSPSSTQTPIALIIGAVVIGLVVVTLILLVLVLLVKNHQLRFGKRSTHLDNHTYQVSAHRPHPLHGGGGVATSANEAYGVRLGGEVAESVGCGAGGNEEVELSGNVAYTATGGGGAGEGENYDYVTRSDVLITATPNEKH